MYYMVTNVYKYVCKKKSLQLDQSYVRSTEGYSRDSECFHWILWQPLPLPTCLSPLPLSAGQHKGKEAMGERDKSNQKLLEGHRGEPLKFCQFSSVAEASLFSVCQNGMEQ